MTEQEVKDIYERLLNLTKARKIHWKKTDNYEYLMNFSRSSVVIEKDFNYVEPPIVMKVFNEDGVLIAYASLKDLEEGESVKAFNFDTSELFRLVQEQVHKYSETSKNLLDELKELELRSKREG
ncbi:MAG: hypothetical protein DMF68_14735 [Acidobacteria bacterium]|nr:MAG: hypothetical protein DMF68_14735 [Acidobacteriota bacterium]